MVARALAVLFASLVLVPTASAAAPTNLRAFLLRSNEAQPANRVFPRTPSFAWDSVPGATRYEFELATSSTFAENALVWEKTGLTSPVATVPLTLPWMTGATYSWYARVRAVVNGAATGWSARYGFNVRSDAAPVSLSEGVNPWPGMIRWTPVSGATAYEVVFLFEEAQGKSKKIKTATTAADLREYYTFHNDIDWANVVYWRVRAVRELEGKPLNALPVASYGPWSARNRTLEPPIGTSLLDAIGSISRSGSADIAGTNANPGFHRLVPGFWWNGMLSPDPDRFGPCPWVTSALGLARDVCPLYHVYVYTDADCVNRVHVSDLVGSPAYVPRLSSTLALPSSLSEVTKATALWLGDGPEPTEVFDAGSEKVKAVTSLAAGSTDRQTGLWDNDWATSRYYWTVVPVTLLEKDGVLEYHDVAFGQDMCVAGEGLPFGKTSATATTSSSGVPYASGQRLNGLVGTATTSRPSFYGRPLVAWKTAPGAQRYQVQWSRRSYPWTTAGSLSTASTSAVLPLSDGVWYYRVRGLDPTILGAQGMTWSAPTYVKVLPRTFTIQ